VHCSDHTLTTSDSELRDRRDEMTQVQFSALPQSGFLAIRNASETCLPLKVE
jgi:hypothetical protein